VLFRTITRRPNREDPVLPLLPAPGPGVPDLQAALLPGLGARAMDHHLYPWVWHIYSPHEFSRPVRDIYNPLYKFYAKFRHPYENLTERFVLQNFVSTLLLRLNFPFLLNSALKCVPRAMADRGVNAAEHGISLGVLYILRTATKKIVVYCYGQFTHYFD
jgi:hypothetical protein